MQFRAVFLSLSALAALASSLSSATAGPPAPPLDELASPGHPGWLVEQASGCWVWNPNPQPGETASWTGACDADGPATGEGTLTWQGDGQSTYAGAMSNGRANGHGVSTDKDGVRAEGNYVDWEKSGHFVVTAPDGGRLEGEYAHNQLNGHVVARAANGAYYDGEYRNDQRNGQGTMTFSNRMKYQGEWKDNRPHGQGDGLIGGLHFVGAWVQGCFRNGSTTAAITRPTEECR